MRNEGRNVDHHRTGTHAGFVLATKASLRFADRHFFGIAKGDFLKIAVSDMRFLAWHFGFLW